MFCTELLFPCQGSRCGIFSKYTKFIFLSFSVIILRIPLYPVLRCIRNILGIKELIDTICHVHRIRCHILITYFQKCPRKLFLQLLPDSNVFHLTFTDHGYQKFGKSSQPHLNERVQSSSGVSKQMEDFCVFCYVLVS